jgi:hypothetical protein
MIQLVQEYGIRHWGLIGSKLNARSGKQCRERWHNQLDPTISKEEWSEEEERILLKVKRFNRSPPHWMIRFNEKLGINGPRLQNIFQEELIMRSKIIGTVPNEDFVVLSLKAKLQLPQLLNPSPPKKRLRCFQSTSLSSRMILKPKILPESLHSLGRCQELAWKALVG